MHELPELLLIDKPKGLTSFDVIRRLRKATGIKKFGHAGTLDPLATGLMLIGVEKGTKRLTELVKLDKEYLAEILVGESRTTGDMEGEVVEVKNYEGDVDEERLRTVLAEMIGTLELPVSAYSAIKKDGVPMYKRARAAEKKGEVVTEVPMRSMVVHEAEMLAQSVFLHNEQTCLLATVRFSVGSGTYIRSLAEEFGKRIGYPATLYNLRRTQVGEYRIENSQPLDSF